MTTTIVIADDHVLFRQGLAALPRAIHVRFPVGARLTGGARLLPGRQSR
jgi:hypothetical protein